MAEYRTASLRKLDALGRLERAPADPAEAGTQASLVEDMLDIALASDEARLAAEQALGQMSREARELRHAIRNLVSALAGASTLLRRRAAALGNDDLIKIADMLHAAARRGEPLCGEVLPKPNAASEAAHDPDRFPVAQLPLALPPVAARPAWNEVSVSSPSTTGLSMSGPAAVAGDFASDGVQDEVALHHEVRSSLDGLEYVVAFTGSGRQD